MSSPFDALSLLQTELESLHHRLKYYGEIPERKKLLSLLEELMDAASEIDFTDEEIHEECYSRHSFDEAVAMQIEEHVEERHRSLLAQIEQLESDLRHEMAQTRQMKKEIQHLTSPPPRTPGGKAKLRLVKKNARKKMKHKICLEYGEFGWDYIIRDMSTDRTVYVQSDWDYPGVASSFGWIACKCGETDGTVDCPHKSASQMIASARKFLDKIADSGKCVEDPGYF